MQVPKNFVDPEHQIQNEVYSNPIWSRTALISLIEHNGYHCSVEELLSLYRKNQNKKEALSFRIKAMLRDKQLIQLKSDLYLPSFFPIKRGVVLCKNGTFMAKYFDDESTVELQGSKENLYQGDICDFHCIGKKQTAFLNRIVKPHEIYVEGLIEEASDYDVPPSVGAVLLVTQGAYAKQAICLYPCEKLNDHIREKRVIAKLDRFNEGEYIFASLAQEEFVPNKDIMQIITKYHLPCTVEQDVLQQSKKLSSSVRQSKSHRDLSHLNFVTIDGETAKDFDDAVYAERKEDGFDLYVAIADVSSYVKPESPIDIEAAKRGVSVYFPKFVIPMLPEKLSNDLCSLRPQRLRKTLTCRIEIRNNKVERYEFFPATIRSKARLTYEQVHHHKVPKSVKDDVDNLWSVYKILKSLRAEKGYLVFETKSPFFKFNQQTGHIDNITHSANYESCKLIEEMMLCANVCAAKFLRDSFKNRGVFRSHPDPLEEKVASLNSFLEPYNIELTAPYTIEKINEFSAQIKKAEPALAPHISRLMQRAFYQTEPAPHFGLNEDFYTHFTSPIRRYPDLIVHRLIYLALEGKNQLADFNLISSQLSEVNFLERRAEEAERFYHQMLKSHFAATLKGKTLEATITGLSSFGFFIECKKFPLEGLVHFKAIDSGYCELEGGYISCENGAQFIIGQKCHIKVQDIDFENYRINFKLVR